MKRVLSLIVLLLVLGQFSASGQTAEKAAGETAKLGAAATPAHPRDVVLSRKATPVQIPQVDIHPVVDGRLDDEVWKKAIVLKDFYQVQPGDNTPPSQPTQVLLAYDTKFLYLAFRAHDEPGKVRSTVAKRDTVLHDDYVGVYLDTFNDQRKAYGLFFNPLGVQQDGILTEGSEIDYSVDILMESKGAIDDEGYCVEVAIPFKSLRYKAGQDNLWGIHLVRRIQRFNNELDSWMPLSRDISGLLTQAGHITAFEGLSAERSIELMPTFTLSESGRRARTFSPFPPPANAGLPDSGRFLNKPIEFEPGLTAKFNIKSNLILDFTVNPDFAQVEADALVVTVNERFPIFYPEKRPFFLEGIDIFQTPLSAVHTRTIIDPDYAAKLTGKQGRNSFGVLFARDSGPGQISDIERDDPVLFPAVARFSGRKSHVGVLRMKRDVGKESSLGFIATSYDFVERHNRLVGVDGRFRLDPQSFLSFQVLGTNTRGFFPDPLHGNRLYRTGNGFAYYLNYNRASRHFNLDVLGQGLTRDYNANIGFTRRTNTNFKQVIARYNSEPKPEAKLISWSFQQKGFFRFDWQARTQRWEVTPQLTLNLQRQTFISPYIFQGYEQVFEEEFGAKRTPTQAGAFGGDSGKRETSYKGVGLEFGTTPSKQYSFRMDTYYNWGWFDLDFGGGPRFPRVSPAALRDPNAPLDPGGANWWYTNLTFSYQPTNALRSSLDFTKSRLVRRDTGRPAFDSHIYSWRTTYQFTRFTFARVRIDFDSLQSNALGQFLVGYTPNPGTSFYVGYNDNLNYNGFSPLTGRREEGFQRNSRTFFIKMSYLIRRGF
ncbi:MAG TPA: carbohydrate binding family 9 domain-containing protein [Pyrinomonadaceae bacterium]|jgi:hypothetical protein|nr:carbohydrate binding family 9 domain-containing protein [Pyrinomonadaceae bacterium]